MLAQRIWSESIFAVSSLSDYLDGFIARRYNLTSDFGAFIDPVADKVDPLLETHLISLSLTHTLSFQSQLL